MTAVDIRAPMKKLAKPVRTGRGENLDVLPFFPLCRRLTNIAPLGGELCTAMSVMVTKKHLWRNSSLDASLLDRRMKVVTNSQPSPKGDSSTAATPTKDHLPQSPAHGRQTSEVSAAAIPFSNLAHVQPHHAAAFGLFRKSTYTDTSFFSDCSLSTGC